MKNGKISQFLQKHGLHLVCIVALLIGIAYGIHSCKDAVDIDINARRNRVNLQLPK